MGGTQAEIIDLLEKIVVFEVSFKKEIVEKLPSLDGKRLQELKKILLEVGEWQTDFLQKKIIEDPDFYDKIVEARRQADKKIIGLYKQKFEAEDHKKMEIILNKIKEL